MHRWNVESEDSKVIVEKIGFENERPPMMTFLEFVNSAKKSALPGLPKLPRLPKLARLPKSLGQGTGSRNATPTSGHVRRTIASLIVLLRQMSQQQRR